MEYFPKPYPSELIYSIIARYQAHLLIKNKTQVIKKLFQREKIPSNYVFPSHLNNFYKSASQVLRIRIETLVACHTLYPFLKRFLNSKKQKNILDQLLFGGSKRDLNIIGDFNANTLKYCPICIEEDRMCFGETYWHLDHHLPMVNNCPKHFCDLRSWHAYGIEDPNFFYHAEHILTSYQKPSFEQCMDFMSRDIISVFDSSTDFFYERMIQRAIEKKFVYVSSSSSSIRCHRGLESRFVEYVKETNAFEYIGHLNIERSINMTLNNRLYRVYVPMNLLLHSYFKKPGNFLK